MCIYHSCKTDKIITKIVKMCIYQSCKTDKIITKIVKMCIYDTSQPSDHQTGALATTEPPRPLNNKQLIPDIMQWRLQNLQLSVSSAFLNLVFPI
jgi:hypothetical protein